MPHGGPKVPQKAAPGTTKRIFGYIFQYKWHVVAIVLCILIGAAAQAGSALFLQSLIDSYILPLVGVKNPDWNPLLRAPDADGLPLRGRHFLQLAVAVAHRHRRTRHPEEDPRRHVRTPADAADPLLRHQRARRHHEPLHQRHRHPAPAISQSFPQMFSSAISALAALVSMLWLSVPVTIFVLVFAAILFVVVRAIVSRSGRYFVKQQMWIGDVNAFVEESVNGQKVIKVFNHEDATQKTFDEKNEELFHASAEANTRGNVTMPVVGNMGYILYILLAIVGGFMALSGMGNFGLAGAGKLTLGALISLLTLSRSFVNPLGQSPCSSTW